MVMSLANRKAYPLANRHVNFLCLNAGNKLGSFIIVQLKTRELER